MNSAILTIDDISSKNTPAIVDYLKEKGIIAVMFAVGQNVEKYYDEAIYAVKAGMIVGNHSYSHPAFSKLSFEEAVIDIEKNEEVLNKLYKDAGVERVYRPFRFPYGDGGGEISGRLQEYFKEQDYDKLDDGKITLPWWKEYGRDKLIDTFWTYDVEEYRIPWGTDFTVEDVWKKMKDRNPKQGTALLGEDRFHLILLHAHDETEAIVPEYYKQFIDYMISQGMIFVQPQFI